MALFDITLLQSTLVPVAANLTVAVYENPTPGMTPVQITSFETANVPAATGATDSNGHVQLNLPINTSLLIAATGFSPVYATTPSAAGSLFAMVLAPTPLCVVTGTVTGPDGSPQSNVTITANLNASGPIEGSNLILASAPSTTTDTNGRWALSLMPNDLIEPKNTLYTFVFTQPANVAPAYPFFSFGMPTKPHGPSIARAVEVPNVASIDFSQLVG